MDTDQVTTAFYMVARLADKLGETPIKGKVWEHRIDDHWFIKINGHSKEMQEIPPYCMTIEYDGFPAGCISPFDGTMLAGEEINEDEFIDAVIAKLESMGADMSQIQEEDMRKKGQARISDDQAVEEINTALDEWEDLE